MPGFDRTGPMGAGPATGWGLGLCRRPGSRVRDRWWGFGRGIGRGGIPWGGGRGRGFGGRGGWWGAWGRGYFFGAPLPRETEAEDLKAALAAARNEIAAMESRLQELEKEE